MPAIVDYDCYGHLSNGSIILLVCGLGGKLPFCLSPMAIEK
jgi:hypothetical protein